MVEGVLRFPTGLVSVVADSYDLFRAVTEIFGDELRDVVMARQDKGRIVIRPDSGDPSVIITKASDSFLRCSGAVAAG